MRKNEIIREIQKITNIDKEPEEKLRIRDIENVLGAFKEVMLDCIEKQEDFAYSGFIEVATTVEEAKMVRNPKTEEKKEVPRRYNAKITFAHSLKTLIKSLVVVD